MNVDELPSDLNKEVSLEDLPKDLKTQDEVIPPAKSKQTTDPERLKYAKDVVGSDSSSNNLLNLARTAAGQGFLAGYGDELEAALRTGSISDEDYKKTRDQIRNELRAYKAQNPKTATAAEFAGGFASLAVPGSGALRGIKGAAALGALSGLGSSEAELLSGNKADLIGAAEDTATGGTLGALIAKYPKAAMSLLAGAAGYSHFGNKEDPLSVQNALVAAAPALATAAIAHGVPKTDAAKAFKAGREGVPLTSHAEFGQRQAVDINKITGQLNELRENYNQTTLKNLQELGDKLIKNPLDDNPAIKAKFKEVINNDLLAMKRRGERLPPKELIGLIEKQHLTPEEFIKLDSFASKRAAGEGNQDLYKFMSEFERKGREAGLSPTYDAKSAFRDISSNISEPITGARSTDLDPLSKDQQTFSGIGDFIRDKKQEAKNAAFANMSATQSRISETNPELADIVGSTVGGVRKASEESRLAGVVGGEAPTDATGMSKLFTKAAQMPAWSGFQAGALTKAATDEAKVFTKATVDKLSSIPGTSHIGKLLGEALSSGDRWKQGAALLLIKQNEQARKAAGIELNQEQK